MKIKEFPKLQKLFLVSRNIPQASPHTFPNWIGIPTRGAFQCPARGIDSTPSPVKWFSGMSDKYKLRLKFLLN